MVRTRGKNRLSQLAYAHERYPMDYTPRMEDYLEVIYELIKEKGYATTIDISKHLHVKAPSVTIMVRKLHEDQFLIYEKYRGIKMTPKGDKVARSIRERHSMITEFLKLLGVDEETAHKDAEGIEHDLHRQTLTKFATFVNFVLKNPEWFKPLKKHVESSKIK